MPAPSPHAALAAAATLARTLLSAHVLTATPAPTGLALPLLLALIESSAAAVSLYWSPAPDIVDPATSSSWAHALVPGILLAMALATGHAANHAVPPTLALAVFALVAAVVSSAILPAVRSRRGVMGGGVPPRLVPVLSAMAVGVLALVVVYARVVEWIPSVVTLGGFVMSTCGFALIPTAQLVSVKTLGVAAIALLAASVPAGVFSALLFASPAPLPLATVVAFALASAALILALAHSSATSSSRGAASGESAAFLIASLAALALWARGIPGDALATSPILSIPAFALVYGPGTFLAYLHYRASSKAGQATSPRYADVSSSDNDDEPAHLGQATRRPTTTSSSTTLVLAAFVGTLLSSTLLQLYTTPAVRLTDPCASLLFDAHHPVRASPPGQRVLVTGGAGFIGSHLAGALLALGYSVRVFDDFSSGAFNNLVHLVGNPALEVRVGDVMNATQVKGAVAGVEYVYHLAATAPAALNAAVDPKAARRRLEVNAMGTINVLNASRADGGVRKVVYAGSAGYYGIGRGAVSEDGKALGVVSVDASSKFEGEIQMDIYDRIFNLSTTTLRVFPVYGASTQPSSPVGVFLDQIKRNTSLTIQGDGSQVIDFVHVDDAVTALILAQQSQIVRNQVINVGTGIGRSIQSVADLLSSRQTHVPTVHTADMADTLADTCKAKRLLGFAATRDLHSSLHTLLADTRDPARLTSQPAFQQLARNLTSTPWLLPPSSLAHVYRPGLYNLTLAARAATSLPTFIPRPTNASNLLVVIPYFKHLRALAEHTHYTVHTHGRVPHILLVAENTDAARDCLTLNLACFNAEGTPLPAVVARLARQGLTVHVARPGAAYVRDAWASFGALIERTGADMLVPAGWTPELAGGGGYVVTPAAADVMQAVADADADDDDEAADVNAAFGRRAHYCTSRDECAAGAAGKVRVVQFTAAYECMPTAGGGSPLDEVCDAFAGGHVVYYDAACVKENEEVSRAMRRAGVWWMAEGMCPRDKEVCVGVPKRMVGQEEPGKGSECFGGVAKMVAVAN